MAEEEAASQAAASAADAACECADLLAALLALRTHLWFGCEAGRTSGVTVILALDRERGQLVVDALRDGARWPAGDVVWLEAQVDGRRLRFEARLDAHVTHDGRPACRLTEPRLVLDLQRRSSYRVRVPASLRLPAALRRGSQVMPARVMDVSTRGCNTRVDTADSLDPGDALRVELLLAGMDLACSATIRHVERLAGATRVGMEFELPPQTDLHAIEQAVARLQREILRRRQTR